MAALWILLFASVITYVAHTANAIPEVLTLHSRLTRSSAADKCFDELYKTCDKVLPAHGSVAGLENPTNNNWYHCECTNHLNTCIRDILGTFTVDSRDPAYDQYGWVTGYSCYRERGDSAMVALYEKVSAPLNDPDVSIYW